MRLKGLHAIRKVKRKRKGGFVNGGFGECAFTPFSGAKVHPPCVFVLLFFLRVRLHAADLPFVAGVKAHLPKPPFLDDRQITHLTCIRLRHLLYDFFRGGFGPLI